MPFQTTEAQSVDRLAATSVPITSWPDQLFETGEFYGSETFILSREEAEYVTADLNAVIRAGAYGDDFAPLTVDEHCIDWDLRVTERGDTAIYDSQTRSMRVRQVPNSTTPPSVFPCEFAHVDWLDADEV